MSAFALPSKGLPVRSTEPQESCGKDSFIEVKGQVGGSGRWTGQLGAGVDGWLGTKGWPYMPVHPSTMRKARGALGWGCFHRLWTPKLTEAT